MKALVIYDSVYGNTEKIAQAIGSALDSPDDLNALNDVIVLRVGDFKPGDLAGVGLLILGSPTQKFKPLPTASSFLKEIPEKGLRGVRVTAFDTRFEMDETQPGTLRFFVKIFGYAAEPLAEGLKKKGGTLVVLPEGFIVEGIEGPLREGELERAVEWAKKILSASR